MHWIIAIGGWLCGILLIGGVIVVFERRFVDAWFRMGAPFINMTIVLVDVIWTVFWIGFCWMIFLKGAKQ